VNDVEANVSRPEPTDDPRGRARLVIAPLVVERVVDGAARRVPGVRAVPGRLGRDALRVEAKVLGRVASVSLDIGVGYPSPVRETCRQVRERVTAEVLRTTGIELTRLDVQVAALLRRRSASNGVR